MTDHRSDAADVVVGIVTHRRPEQLGQLLERLTGQLATEPEGRRLAVVVVDNSPDREAEVVVRRYAAKVSFPVQYVPHGAGNIASGRNALLDAAAHRAPVMACLDDDEIPADDWLAALVGALGRAGADIVVGPVLARYPSDAPAWISRPVFHSVPDGWEEGWVTDAWSGNFALATELIGRLGLRFDERLGISGGEDQLFFRQAREGGARIYYAPQAIAHEWVPRDRLSLRYLLRREYRKGTTLGLLDRASGHQRWGKPARRLLKAAFWLASGGLAAVRSAVCGQRSALALGLMRAARGLGMVGGLLGRTIDLYVHGETDPASSPATIAVVAAEGPEYQHAGHARHLAAFVSRYRSLGFRVAVVVTGSRTGFLVRKSPPGEVYYSPALRTIGGVQFVSSPVAIATQLAWWLFRRSPRVLQAPVDRLRTRLRARAGVAHVLGAWPTAATSRWVAQTLEELQPQAVFYNTIFTVPSPPVRPASVTTQGLIAHDVVSERAESFRAAGHAIRPADFSASTEATWLQSFDTITAIQWDDARTLRSMAPRAHVVVTPVALQVEPAPRDGVVPGRCLFVGSGSLHNVEAINWFLEECWPTVARRNPGSELHVVGTVCARLGKVPDQVILRGELPDLAPEYAAASVAIAPLRSGSGLKVKVVESICHGLATVTTAVGAQGLGALDPRPYLLADEATAFADGVVRLLRDPGARRELEHAAADAAELFAPGRAYAELDERLADVGIIPKAGGLPGSADAPLPVLPVAAPA
ncbi:glycosyltransferase [Blastococcus sp. VKM Ac-2987]|uniref:glycosyltransferase n=1 Tax=Blastococcus sp. VKM Ac-2987 TaxID=3004141 RepID=UPI0022AB7AF7|nr:glycosyltransferase [Blastococcus sp. VKM Ac-2987]MCZ2858473.1 glycosyltransferase [Blastococcus sp. VKM Ac-2987]